MARQQSTSPNPASKPQQEADDNSATYMDRFFAMEKTLDKKLAAYPFFLKLERQTGVKKSTLVTSAAGFILCTIVFSMFTELIAAIAAYAYPAYATYILLESTSGSVTVGATTGLHRMHAWLTYWLVLSTLLFAEEFAGHIFTSVIPFYNLLKIALCVWMYLPSTKGADIVYARALRPAFIQISRFMPENSSEKIAAVADAAQANLKVAGKVLAATATVAATSVQKAATATSDSESSKAK